jgi:Region found in RelA / SpoT proteins
MQLARMQDIGGIRAILGTMKKVRRLERVYRERKLQHELVSSKDYIAEPKTDGYRGIHLIYRYKNLQESSYNGLLLELQLRTKLQHAWATAVETMGTFLVPRRRDFDRFGALSAKVEGEYLARPRPPHGGSPRGRPHAAKNYQRTP